MTTNHTTSEHSTNTTLLPRTHAPPTSRRTRPTRTGRSLDEQWYEDHGVGLFLLARLLTGEPNEASTVVARAIADRSTWPERLDQDSRRVRSDLAGLIYRHARTRTRGRAPTAHRVRIAKGWDVAKALPPAMTWLDAVSTQQREAIALCLYGGCTYRDAADQLGLSAPQVAALLTSGLHELATCRPEPQ